MSSSSDSTDNASLSEVSQNDAVNKVADSSSESKQSDSESSDLMQPLAHDSEGHKDENKKKKRKKHKHHDEDVEMIPVSSKKKKSKKQRETDDDDDIVDAEDGVIKTPTVKISTGKTVSFRKIAKDAGFEGATVIVDRLSYAAKLDTGSFSTILNQSTATVRLPVLENHSFILKKGQMTALLGAPKSGKTSLLDVMVGTRDGTITGIVDVEVPGKVFTGRTFHKLYSYTLQQDVHLPLLTVRETFYFAARFQGVPAADVERISNVILQLLELTNCADTIVGGPLVRGISGGEKRRVTVGAAWLRRPNFLLLDEPTTGLDSAAALRLSKVLQILSQEGGVPVMASLLQPAEEVLNLYDQVILLSNGRIAYAGPRDKAKSYFQKLGFECPDDYNAGEYLSTLVDNPLDFATDKCKITRSSELIYKWNESKEKRKITKEINKGETLNTSKTATTTISRTKKETSPYDTTTMEQIGLLLHRKLLHSWREKPKYIVITLNLIFLSLILGFFFFRFDEDYDQIALRLGFMYSLSNQIGLLGVGIIGTIFQWRPIFDLHRKQHWHSVVPFMIVDLIHETVWGFWQVFVFGSIGYWAAGLRADVGAYFFFLLTSYFLYLSVLAIIQVVAYLSPSQSAAFVYGSNVIAFLILYSGFLIQRGEQPGYLVWLFWINPMFYAFNAIAINEFFPLTFECSADDLVPPTILPTFNATFEEGGFEGNQVCPLTTGTQALESRSFLSGANDRWYMLIGLFGWVVFWNFALYLAMRFSIPKEVVRSTPKKLFEFDLEEDNALLKEEIQGAVLSWKDLNYFVPGKPKTIQLLTNINGYVKPGMVVALMGPSGAGKTTLLDVLAQRKNIGSITGEVLIDGAVTGGGFAASIGYCEQTDVHMHSQTVFETVQFSARLRYTGNDEKAAMAAHIDRTMKVLDLVDIANELVENLSQAQAKRVTIAIEYVVSPPVIFLDEPTSGLDSAGADEVMTAIANIAKEGCSVVCTIHQPSTRIFDRCSHLLLLKRGGIQVYFGPTGDRSKTLLNHFKNLGYTIPNQQNPADVVLDIASSKLKSKDDDRSLPDQFKDTKLGIKLKKDLKKLHKNPAPPAKRSKRYNASFALQLSLNSARWWRYFWRQPIEFTLGFIRTLFVSLLLGLTYLQTANDQTGANERVNLVFFSALFANLFAFGIIPRTYETRAVYYREKSAGMYSSISYVLGMVLLDLPTILITVVVSSTIVYILAGLNPTFTAYLFYMLGSFGLMLATSAFALAVSFLTPNIAVGNLSFSAFLTLNFLTAGFITVRSAMPNWFGWWYWISFIHYSLEALSINELKDRVFECPGNVGAIPISFQSESGMNVTQFYCPITNGNIIIDAFEMNVDLKWIDMVVLYGIYFVFVIIAMLALRFIRHQKR